MDEDQWYALAKSQQSAEWRQGYATALTDLRAKVEALPVVGVEFDDHIHRGMIQRDRVLALIDGVRVAVLADLRANIEADRDDLNRRILDRSGPYWSPDAVDRWTSERVALNRVLALMDGRPE